jgi:hypothetical protein
VPALGISRDPREREREREREKERERERERERGSFVLSIGRALTFSARIIRSRNDAADADDP